MFHPDQAVSLFEEALAEFRSLGDRWGEASTLGSMSNALSYLDSNKAAELNSQARRILEELGDLLGTAELLYQGASAANDRLDADHAVEMIEEALVLFRQLGSNIGEGHSLEVFGEATALQGHATQARRTLEEALKVLTEVGDAHCSARTLHSLGSLDLEKGEPTSAMERFKEALVMSSRVDDKLNTARVLEGTGQAALAIGDTESAAILIGAAERHRNTLTTPRLRKEERRHKNALKDLYRQSDASSLDAAWNRGQSMHQAEAVAFALGYSPVENPTTPNRQENPTRP
jgi:tetratricopeptide (TPR) repeat protein